MFQGAQYELQMYLDMVWCFVVAEMKQDNIRLVLGLSGSSRLEWRWIKIMRWCISAWFRDNLLQMGRNNLITEIDETCMTQKKKYGVGNAPNRARWVLGMVERGTNRKRHIYLGDQRTRDIILPVILRWIAPGARIMTDNFRAYWTLPDHGYIHGMVNHSIEFVNVYNPEIHTETVEGGFRHMKRSVPTGCRTQHLQSKLDEWDFRSMYFRTSPRRAVWIMLRLLGKYGIQAVAACPSCRSGRVRTNI